MLNIKVTLKLLLCLCVWFYSLFVYNCVCVLLHIQSPLRECRSIWSGASGLPYFCALLVCVSDVIELLAVWRHNKPKTKNHDWNVRCPTRPSGPVRGVRSAPAQRPGPDWTPGRVGETIGGDKTKQNQKKNRVRYLFSKTTKKKFGGDIRKKILT